MKNSPWYTIQNISEIDSPALVIYPQRIQKNIDRMITLAGNVSRLRPHVKTHKMAEVVKMQMQNGIQKFKCATIAEAEMLAQTGVVNVLLAYQPVGPKIHRLAELVAHFPKTKFACLVDNTAAAQNIASVFLNAFESFSEKNNPLDVWLDLDVGQHRTGVFADQRALDLFLFCEKLEGINPVGFHVYDGHIRDTEFSKRKKRSDECFQLVEKLVTQLTKLNFPKPKIVAGGSPSFSVHVQREEVDCSPGTCLLWDWGYQQMLPEYEFQHAALVISRIISKPSKNLICLDLGHKSIAAENPHPRVHFLNLPNAQVVGQSEEHLVLEVGDNSEYEIGKVFYGVPQHICPTVALYESANVVNENGEVKTHWKVVARDRKITI